MQEAVTRDPHAWEPATITLSPVLQATAGQQGKMLQRHGLEGTVLSEPEASANGDEERAWRLMLCMWPRLGHGSAHALVLPLCLQLVDLLGCSDSRLVMDGISW